MQAHSPAEYVLKVEKTSVAKVPTVCYNCYTLRHEVMHVNSEDFRPAMVPPGELGMKSDTNDIIDAGVARDMADFRIACASVYAERRGKPFLRRNYGLADREANIPLGFGHLFRMASMTKPVIAVCILLEREKGRLDIDDEVSRFLDGYDSPVVGEYDGEGKLLNTRPASRRIKVRDLLTHSSGLGSGPWFGRDLAAAGVPEDVDLTKLAELYAHIPLQFNPGSAFAYSGLAGFDLLAHIVEVTSGQKIEDYLQANICKPLGMRDTTFDPDETQMKRIVTMYASGKGCMTRVDMGNHVFGKLPRSYHCGGAGLVSSLDDYAAFARMLTDLSCYRGPRVLSAESVELLRSVLLPSSTPGLGHGVAWGASVRVVTEDDGSQRPLKKGAYGWSGAYGTHFWCDPVREICVVYLSNMTTAGGSGALTARHIERDIMESIIQTRYHGVNNTIENIYRQR